MTSLKQVKSNRENAKLSTGPTSATGKLKVSGNRITSQMNPLDSP